MQGDTRPGPKERGGAEQPWSSGECLPMVGQASIFQLQLRQVWQTRSGCP